MQTLNITIERDKVGGFRVYFEDWIMHAGHGDTISEAITSATECTQEWLNEIEKEME